MNRPPRRRKRPSMAAVARLQQELEQQREKERELSPELAQVIDNYRPARVPEATMQQITPFLHGAITASALEGAESVRKHCNHLTELALFGLERGLPLEVTALLKTSVIDDYIKTGMSEAKDTLRAERRRRLLALAGTANPGPDVPAKLTPVGHSAIKPCYTPAELAAIVRVSRTQPTPARSRDLACVVCLAAGAGLDSVDMRGLYTEHIEDLDADGILIHVQGPRPRVVPVRARFEDLLRSSLTGRKAGELLLGRKEDRRNTAARVTERAALHRVPHIEPARLRSTWLADLMTDQVPLAVILQAAGLKSARTLSELQPHLGPWLEAKGLLGDESALLRGECR